MKSALISKILAFLILGAGPVNMAQTPIATAEVDGAMMPAAALIPLLNTMAANAAPGPGDFLFSALSTGTQLNASQIINGLVFSQSGGAVTHTLPSAAQIIAQLPGGANSAGSVVNRTFLSYFFNTNTPSGAGVVTVTNTAGNGLTLLGTFTVQVSSVRWVFGQVTSATAVSLTSLGQTLFNLN